jgi:hypothetical protein
MVVNDLLGVKGDFGGEGGGGVGPGVAKNFSSIFACAAGDFVAGFKDDELLSSDECEYCVGRGFGVFDEVAVDVETTAVKPCELNHEDSLPRLLSAER